MRIIIKLEWHHEYYISIYFSGKYLICEEKGGIY